MDVAYVCQQGEDYLPRSHLKMGFFGPLLSALVTMITLFDWLIFHHFVTKLNRPPFPRWRNFWMVPKIITMRNTERISLCFHLNYRRSNVILLNSNFFFISFILIAKCTAHGDCQAGGDANKACTGGSCVCKSGYYLHANGVCTPGKDKRMGYAGQKRDGVYDKNWVTLSVKNSRLRK